MFTDDMDLAHYMRMEAIWILINLLCGDENEIMIILAYEKEGEGTIALICKHFGIQMEALIEKSGKFDMRIVSLILFALHNFVATGDKYATMLAKNT